jgi:sugar phosphate permease
VKNTIAPSRWYRLIPVVFITFSLAYLDRTNFSFGIAGGMSKDLGINASTSSLLGSLFFLGYFFFQVPGAWYASNSSVKKLIFWSQILWGSLAVATGVVANVKVLMVIRFLLGVTESAVLPAMLILLSRWFTRAERSRANTFLILGNPVTMLWMSIMSGYLVDAFGWRWMFILEGAPAIIWAFCWLKLVDNRPAEANWLSDGEKKSIQEQLQAEQKSLKAVKNYRAAFRSRSVILLSAQYAFWSIGVYGFVMWLPSIIKSGNNLTMVQTGWFSAIPYVMAVLGMLSVSYFSDKILQRKIFVWPLLLIGAFALYGSYLVGAGNFTLSFALLVIAGMAMYAPYGPFFAMIPELLPENVAGGATALINSFGALGSFAGAYIVGYLNGITGDFNASYLFMSVSVFLSAILTILAVRKPTPSEKNII